MQRGDKKIVSVFPLVHNSFSNVDKYERARLTKEIIRAPDERVISLAGTDHPVTGGSSRYIVDQRPAETLL